MARTDSKHIIKFGIMCNGTKFPEWQARAIKKLLAHPSIVCKLIIVNAEQSKRKSALKKLNLSNIFWFIYLLLTRRLFKANRMVDLTEDLRAADTLSCNVIRKGKFSEYFGEQDVNKIKEYNLDFVLRFGFGIIRGEILKSAKNGIWSFHHDDEQKYRGGPPCFWEIYNNDAITGTILQKLNNKLDAGTVLKKGYLKTKFSYHRNRDQMYFESANWPYQLCMDLLYNRGKIEKKTESQTQAPIYYAPRNFQFILFIFKVLYCRLKKLLRRSFFTDYWNIGISHGPISDFLKGQKPQVNWYPGTSKKRFLADPFGVIDKDDPETIHILFESYPFSKVKGQIDYIKFKNEFTGEKNILSEKEHLSYPYLFGENGEQFLIPECYQSNKVVMYSSSEYPLRWEKHTVLIDNFAGVDSTLIKHDNLYWIFTMDKRNGPHYNLNIFYSDKLTGPYTAHIKNPVKSDIRSSRPAGTPFYHNGKLYRPAMDYSEKVEGRISINEVKTLSTTDYEELVVKEVNPYQGIYFSDKIHTLCNIEKYTLVDGCKEVFILSHPYLLIQLFRKIWKSIFK